MTEASGTSTTTATTDDALPPWWASTPTEVAAAFATDVENGLTAAAIADLGAQWGPNVLHSAPPPSLLKIALRQLAELMTLMLVAVAVVSFLIGQIPIGIVVVLLVVYNVVQGTRQELKARRSVDALAKMQVPQVRVVRDGALQQVPAPELVPGDVVELEAGDLVPADGRLVRAATCETQESALTGESLPIEKGVATVAADTALADRTSMLFQNTSVTRGTATMIVTATGMNTEVGQIATLLSDVSSTRSPLQRELNSLTKVLGIVAWTAVLLIVVMGVLRGQELEELLFLGTAVAISAIPTGLPAFVQSLLSWGASKLAADKAIVASLADVETLGATSAICSDKTGTLTLNAMTVQTVWAAGTHFEVTGGGYSFDGRVLRPGGEVVETTPLALALSLPNDASVSREGTVVGDPTEAALIVLAAKLGVDADAARRAHPRLGEVPFDSAYKYMATFHRLDWQGTSRLVELVKGAPDVVLDRCTLMSAPGGEFIAIDPAAVSAELEALSSQGLRTLAIAARILDEADLPTVTDDPQSLVGELALLGIVGIVDPLRAEAKAAVDVAAHGGIDVRMITGDHVVTAAAIGGQLGLGAGAISGAELRELSDDELDARLPNLHVFGRVTPQDKLRLVQRLQHRGEIVAMTGDAVNDAAAIKQADVGVAMGSGSEVTKQAARLVLTDDNFSTLVHAVEIGRVVYDKVTGYLRFQMSQLFSLILLFLAVSAFAINDGVALFPAMVLFLNFVVTLFAVFGIAADAAPPGIMDRPPRDPRQGIAGVRSVTEWLLYGGAIFVVSLVPLVWGPDAPSPTDPSQSMTMAFVIVGLGTVVSALLMRRSPESGFLPPIRNVLKYLVWPVVLLVLSTELGFLQRMLGTTSLSGWEWLACLGLVLAPVAVIEADKWVKRMRMRTASHSQ